MEGTSGTSSGTSEGKVFKGGLPVDPDVRALSAELLPIWKEGEVLPYERIEQVVKLPWRSTRFRTILDSWTRRLMREQNIDTEAVPGVGLRRLLPNDRIRASQDDMRSATRKSKKALVRIVSVPAERLTDEQRSSKDHSERLIGGALLAAQQACRTFSPPKPTELLPRGGPPVK